MTGAARYERAAPTIMKPDLPGEAGGRQAHDRHIPPPQDSHPGQKRVGRKFHRRLAVLSPRADYSTARAGPGGRTVVSYKRGTRKMGGSVSNDTVGVGDCVAVEGTLLRKCGGKKWIYGVGGAGRVVQYSGGGR
eukprot:763959-Hanusia_phi.AAC.2